MKKILFLLFILISPSLFAQELAKFKIQIEENRIDAPVSGRLSMD